MIEKICMQNSAATKCRSVLNHVEDFTNSAATERFVLNQLGDLLFVERDAPTYLKACDSTTDRHKHYRIKGRMRYYLIQYNDDQKGVFSPIVRLHLRTIKIILMFPQLHKPHDSGYVSCLSHLYTTFCIFTLDNWHTQWTTNIVNKGSGNIALAHRHEACKWSVYRFCSQDSTRKYANWVHW